MVLSYKWSDSKNFVSLHLFQILSCYSFIPKLIKLIFQFNKKNENLVEG